jgi:DNA phosphorothioation-associated putative methyltransferase
MPSVSIARHRTAIRRPELSRPIRLALEEGLLNTGTTVFDYGCGHGDDVLRLNSRSIPCTGWDPIYRPQERKVPADIVNLGYVINVIEDLEERASVLKEAWMLAQKLLIVSARLSVENKEESQIPFKDGWLTRSGTFQKYFEQHELRDWINEALSVSSIPAAPGIFYVFRDDELRQTFLATRYRHRVTLPRQRRSDVLFEQHKVLLDPLIDFVASRGRLPDESELMTSSSICNEFKSLRNAFRLIRRVTGAEQWDRIREQRSQELLIYLALARFSGRPSFSSLSKDLQLDVRAFFSTYKQTCALADDMLFSAGNLKTIDDTMRKAGVGKLTPKALYVHTSALSYLSPVLRIYEGCARGYIGAVEGANVVKLYRDTPQVSYLAYPEFERDPHPSLAASLIVHLQTFRVQYREYTESLNPPILHRKEEFVACDHTLQSKFASLTRQEELCGLYEKPELIGTKQGWQKVVDEKGVYFLGHSLRRDSTR